MRFLEQLANHRGRGMYLTRMRPEANMKRFYSLEITDDLFGGALLIRRWGRIGAIGREHREWFSDPRDAVETRRLWAERKKKRGYSRP